MSAGARVEVARLRASDHGGCSRGVQSIERLMSRILIIRSMMASHWFLLTEVGTKYVQHLSWSAAS